MKIIFLSEIVNTNSLSVDLEDINQLFNDDKAEILIVLSDTSFDIIEGILKFFIF